jgi:signal transduction histidine kinase
MAPPSRRAPYARTVLVVMLSVAAAMAGYEALKELLAPGLTHWQSHGITIVVTTALAAAASFVVSRTQHRLREQLDQHRRMESIGRLAGGIAHDFNNLLTVIITLVKLMSERHREGPDAEDLAQVQSAAERAAELTRQLLGFARKQIISPRIIDINSCVEATEKMLRRVIGEDIELRTILAPDLGAIRADPSQVDQVLMNLVVNAREAMPAGGRLTIETANVTLGEDYVATHFGVTPGPHVMMSVSDTGAGMDKETLEHIFEPFFTTKPFGQGVGLGLATSYGIVKQSEGSIWVYSEPGKGTTFKIYWRLVDAGKAAQPTPEVAPLGGRDEAVLVVEDDPMVRRLAVRVLSRGGYRVSEAADAAAAVSLFEQAGGDFDIVVSDVVMPKMSGGELVEKLRAKRPDLKVLFTSGYTGEEMAQHGVTGNGENYLGKPYTPAALLRRVREILGKSPPAGGPDAAGTS